MFVRAANPIWYMVDHIGQPLNDEYWAFFLTNTLPYLPQSVYRDPQGMTIWTGDKIEFSPAGTLPDNLYFDPNLVYRIEIRHGDTQQDELIWEINNFVPGGGGGNDNNTLSILGNDNQVTNPEFQLMTMLVPDTITVAGTYQVAPGWELVLVGVGGTTTVTRNILSGVQHIVNNPPYSLRVNNNGWTEAFLRQRFNHNGALWAAGAITMSVTARAQTTAQSISLIYAPSAPGVSQVVATDILGTGDYQVVQGAIDLPASANTGLSDVAYVDMIIQLPPTGIVDLTAIQLIGQSDPLPSDFDPATDIPFYQQQTEEREIDHTFHYYRLGLMRKPIPSYLVGWDFPLNPSQRGTVFSSAAGVNTSFYAWDQTIVFQSANSGIQTSRVTNGYFSISATVDTQAAIIQYLPATQARELLTSVLSVYLAAYSASGAGAGAIPITISLWVTADVSLPSIASNNSLVATLDANGKPATFHGTWVEVAPINGQEALFTLISDDMAFDGWWNNAINNSLTATATYFAIVIGTSTITAADSIVIRCVGLQKGTIGTRPAPQTPDQVLRECQAYWEQSYYPGVAAGTVTDNGRQSSVQNFLEIAGPNQTMRAGAWMLPYKSVKNTPPVLKWYAPATGTVDSVGAVLFNGGASVATGNIAFAANWTLANTAGLDSANYIPSSFTALLTGGGAASAPQSEILYHYTADSRLGA